MSNEGRDQETSRSAGREGMPGRVPILTHRGSLWECRVPETSEQGLVRKYLGFFDRYGYVLKLGLLRYPWFILNIYDKYAVIGQRLRLL